MFLPQMLLEEESMLFDAGLMNYDNEGRLLRRNEEENGRRRGVRGRKDVGLGVGGRKGVGIGVGGRKG